MGLFRSRRQIARDLRADTSRPLADKEFTDRLAQVAASSEPTGPSAAKHGVRAAFVAVGACLLVVLAAVGVVWASGVAEPPWAPEDSGTPSVSTSPRDSKSGGSEGTPTGSAGDSSSPRHIPSSTAPSTAGTSTPASPSTGRSSSPADPQGSGPSSPEVSLSGSASVSGSVRGNVSGPGSISPPVELPSDPPVDAP